MSEPNRICPNCGKAADSGNVFCGVCGTRLPQDAAPPPHPASQPPPPAEHAAPAAAMTPAAEPRSGAPWTVIIGVVTAVAAVVLIGGYLLMRSRLGSGRNASILPTPAMTVPAFQCNPPECPDGVVYCPEGDCPAGCGMACATYTALPGMSAPTATPEPSSTATLAPSETPVTPPTEAATMSPSPTPTLVPPTATATRLKKAKSIDLLKPTDTALPTVAPTETPIPPTETAIPPTDTPIPPTATPLPTNTPVPVLQVVDRINAVTQATGQSGPVWVEHRNGIMIQHPGGQWFKCELGFVDSAGAIAAFQQRWDYAARGGATWRMRIEVRKKVGWVSCAEPTCSEKQSEGDGEIYIQVHYSEDVWRSLLNDYVAGGLEQTFNNEHYYPAQDQVMMHVHGDLPRTPIIGFRFTPVDSPW